MRHTLRLISLLVLAPNLTGDVQRVEFDTTQVVADGRSFGAAGPYEARRGRIYFALDPQAPANSGIVDLDLASRNEDGQVEAWGDLFVLRPVDPERSSGVALLEVSNRGGMASLSYFQGARGSSNPTTNAHFGDGLLMNRGHTLIWVGWQFDVPEDKNLRLHVPFITSPTLSGLVRSDWVVTTPTKTLALAHRNHRPYPVSDPASEANVLTVRDGREQERRVVPREHWSFASDPRGDASADPTHVHMPAGFELGKIYELVYRAEEPAVVGMGLAAIRDTMAYAKHNEACEFSVDKGLAVGISQTGRFLRHFLYQGFNTDEAGRQVFDGMLIHTAGAGRGSFNHRFAQPSRDGHRYSAFFYPTDLFPFSGRSQRDPITGQRDALLPDLNLPRIFYTNTGYEYWGRAASLLHTSLDGSADVEPLANERIYHLSSCQHFPVRFPPNDRSRPTEAPVWRGNPIALLRTERALLMNLFDWVVEDIEPPASFHPRIDDGSLVPIELLTLPEVPGLPWPAVSQLAYRADYGERWSAGIIDTQPPTLGLAFPSLVSQVNEVGNEIAGVPSIETLVPLATYTPWNLRTGMAGEQLELTDFYGSFAPLAPTDATREEGDSRPSIEGLYASRDVYVERLEQAAQELLEQRFLLVEDLDAALQQGEQIWDWVHGLR